MPTCAACHASLADVRSTPAADPAHPEHLERLRQEGRRWVVRRQVGFTVGQYVAVIVLLALFPGLVWERRLLIFHGAGALAVAVGVLRGIAGHLAAGILQGAVSLWLVFHFGPWQPFTFLMLACHALAALVFCHSLDLIQDVNR